VGHDPLGRQVQLAGQGVQFILIRAQQGQRCALPGEDRVQPPVPNPPVAPVMTTTRFSRLFIESCDLFFGHAVDDRAVGLLGQVGFPGEVDKMARLGGLGLQVETVMIVRLHDVRDAPVDLESVLGQLLDLFGIVGDQVHGLDLERHQHVGGHRIITLVITEAERQVSFHGVQPHILQAVGADLVDQADTASLLAQVEHDALFHLADHFQRGFELVAAVAAQRTHHVPGQAFGVQAHGDVFPADDFALDDGDVFFFIAVVPESHDVEITITGGQFGNGLDPYANLVLTYPLAFVATIFLD
jgi:hypothetical protein